MVTAGERVLLEAASSDRASEVIKLGVGVLCGERYRILLVPSHTRVQSPESKRNSTKTKK